MNQEQHQANAPSLEESPQSQQNQDQHSQISGKEKGTGFWSTIQSVLGAMFGVQSEQQRQKDFEKGSAVQFIVGGVIFVVVFIVTILYFVNAALEGSGAS